VTGPAENIQAALARTATATIALQPVPPKTVPASSYPAGSTLVGQHLTLSSTPARVWLEVQLTGWAPQMLKTAQATIDSSTFLGANAVCGTGRGGADIDIAQIPCNTSADCRASTSGMGGSCFTGEPSKCVTVGGAYYYWFPPGKYCEPGFFDMCDPRWLFAGLASTGEGTPCGDTRNCRFGGTDNPGDDPTDFHPSYMGTLVLDVPADARGTYTIGFIESGTFMQELDPLGNTVPIPIAALYPAIIEAPSCNENGACDDNDPCTVNICQGGCQCVNNPKPGWNPQTQCCDTATGAVAAIPQSTPCMIAGCSLGGGRGVPTMTQLAEGTSCDLGDPCLPNATCNANGACVAQQDPGPNCAKSRFITFAPSSGTAPTAYRVRLVSLHHPDPPYTGAAVSDFSAFEGQYRWVGAPQQYIESAANPVRLFASQLECAPYYRDWSLVDLLHVSDAEIVPSSIYEVQSIAEGLDINNEGNYSFVGTMATARWGDVTAPFSTPSGLQLPDYGDISVLVNKFKGAAGAPVKARALLAGSDPEGRGIISLSDDVGFMHIAACYDAFSGLGYPYSGPEPCP